MSFDSLAPIYRPMEWALAGSLLHRCRTAYLREARCARNALLLGEGPGQYLLPLLRANPTLRVTCVDSSSRMQAIAYERMAQGGFGHRHVHFVACDWAEWSGEGGPFDWIATHFFFDCFPEAELRELVQRMACLTSGKAFWALSDFLVPDRGWQRIRARIILCLAYSFFRVTTGIRARGVVSGAPFLKAAGFELVRRESFSHELLFAELWQAGQEGPPFPLGRFMRKPDSAAAPGLVG